MHSNKRHPVSRTGLEKHNKLGLEEHRNLRHGPGLVLFPYPLGVPLIEERSNFIAPTCDEAKFLAFLSLYESNGVCLRDLIGFARLRVSGTPSENHWLPSGEVGPILRPVGDAYLPTHCSFLNKFVLQTSNDQGISLLQHRLLNLGLIRVDSPYSSIDERIWYFAENQSSSHLMVSSWHGLEEQNIIMDLLYVFLEMPSKDVSLLAERHRETFYSHARLFALQTLRFNQTILKEARDYVVALVLQILTHRSQDGDNDLIYFAKAYEPSANGPDWAIMVLWAEVKEVISSGYLKIEIALRNRITRLLSWNGVFKRRTNGLLGYFLVDLMKAAETSRDERLSSQIVEFAMDWAETAWYSGSSIERAALCNVLANFHVLYIPALISPKYHLLYGYYLSRAGNLEQAKVFLTSGILYHAPLQLCTRLWGYEFEQVSVLIRLGHFQEAERCLDTLEEHMMSQTRDEGYMVLERLHEHAEISTLIGFYKAEVLMARGEMSSMASRLENILSTVSLKVGSRKARAKGEDDYPRSLRLALEMRLLEVQTWDGPPKRAVNVAKALVIESRDSSPLRPDTVEWIMQQLLTLGNRLVGAGNVLAASSLLESIVETCQNYSDLLGDLLSFAEQRLATVSHLLIMDSVESYPTAVGPKKKALNKKPLKAEAPFNSARVDPWNGLSLRPSSMLRRVPRAPTAEPGKSAVVFRDVEAVHRNEHNGHNDQHQLDPSYFH